MDLVDDVLATRAKREEEMNDKEMLDVLNTLKNPGCASATTSNKAVATRLILYGFLVTEEYGVFTVYPERGKGLSMRVFQKDVGKWCKCYSDDEQLRGIVIAGGQDKRFDDSLYRKTLVFDPACGRVVVVDWTDIDSVGPAAKAPRF